MVTADKKTQEVAGQMTTNVTLYGLSTDSKPVDCGNGSAFVEMDTGKVYFFNAAASAWAEFGG